MTEPPPPVRAVYFDAVGTLIHPSPSAAEAYFNAGRRYGSSLDLATVKVRFAEAFRAEEAHDAAHGHRTSEEREVQRWRHIVAAVLDDVADPEACFAGLYDHFAQPRSWRVEPGAGEVLGRFKEAGHTLGIASNFDLRLRGILAGHRDVRDRVRHLAISSEVGWKKPAPGFFAALSGMTGLPADQILIVGDDAENDIEGARRAGMRALLFDPRRQSLADCLSAIPG